MEVQALRLGNNLLRDFSLLSATCLHNLIDASKVLWLDLSFNEITKTDEVSALFPNVTTVYLHANKIAKLGEIKKISKLSKLKSLSMYGCPVEENKHYRNYVLYSCKLLTQFDASPVTASERRKSEIFEQTFRKKLHPCIPMTFE